MTTFNAEAEIGQLVTQVKLRKEQAKDYRDDGDIDAAVQSLDDAISMLEVSPLYNDLTVTEAPTAPQKTLAFHLADCLGMKGGNLRRLNEFSEALDCFKRGRTYEESKYLNVPSSYNLVNAIVLPLETGTKTAELQDELTGAVAAIQRQVDGERRNDRWAWADLGQCQLLLGDREGAIKSYKRVRELGNAETAESVVAVLRRLARAIEKTERGVADALEEGAAFASG
jgi:tetratricopeptide (TPR) repeat protein